MMSRCSYEGEADINSVTQESDETIGQIVPVKKLSEAFDNCVKSEGNMKVYLRIRPSSSKILTDSTITVLSENTIATTAPDTSKRAAYTKLEERKYAFTRVFAPTSQQVDVYSLSVAPLFDRFLEGDNCLLFAYGMTNSGKTHTVQGTSGNPGLFPRLVNEILETMILAHNKDWELQVSMLEIYQEKIYDLLSEKEKEKLVIRDRNGIVEVCKLSSHSIASSTDTIRLMDSAAERRSKSTTFLNIGSSRSHAVYTLTLSQKHVGKDMIFQVVDLAGAERGNRTKATAAQQKEANNINNSLSKLWRCLQAMRKKTETEIIPFRESKLTHLLMPSLCRVGLAGVAMIVCVNPQTDDYDETITILGNASLASKISDIGDLRRPVAMSSSLALHQVAQVQQPIIEEHKEPKEKKESIFAAAAALAITAATALGKRRRLNHATTAVPAVEKRPISKRGSAITQKAATITVTSAIDTDAGKIVSKSTSENNDNEIIDNEEEVDGLEYKRMRLEISRLKDENQGLLSEQFNRETEIRVEVSIEMAMRSAHLLDQLQDLQSQLDEKESKPLDITRSCKKVRRRQIDKANEDLAKDLQEAEEEIERMKVIYDQELNQLRVEVRLLEQKLLKFKNEAEVNKSLDTTKSSSVPNNTSKSSDASSSRYESNDITVSEGHSSFSTVPIVSDLTSSKTTSTGIVSSSIASEAIPTPLSVPLIQVVVPTAIASRVTHASLVRSSMASTSSSSSSVVCDENAKKNSIASEFSSRMSRDQRFKKVQDNNDENSIPVAGSILKRNVLRSPLGSLKEDSNSPNQKQNINAVSWGKSSSPNREKELESDSYRLKEKLYVQLVQKISPKKNELDKTDEKNNVEMSESVTSNIGNPQNEAKRKRPISGEKTLKVRAKIVSARNVLSTRINQAPEILAAYHTAQAGQNANPNAGEYVSRLRTRAVR